MDEKAQMQRAEYDAEYFRDKDEQRMRQAEYDAEYFRDKDEQRMRFKLSDKL